MRHFLHITTHVAPDPSNYVQMVGYHTLEDAYHRLLERGEINIPRHQFDSHDFNREDVVNIDSLDSDKFKFGGDKYEASAAVHNMQFNPPPAPTLDPVPEPSPAPSSEPPKE